MTLSPCAFCLEFGPGGSVLAQRRPTWEFGDFVVAPTIGPLAPGHLLLLPRQHVPAIGMVSQAATRELPSLIELITSTLEARFGPTISFEHGTSGKEGVGGCGVDHAHMHFVPVSEALK